MSEDQETPEQVEARTRGAMAVVSSLQGNSNQHVAALVANKFTGRLTVETVIIMEHGFIVDSSQEAGTLVRVGSQKK